MSASADDRVAGLLAPLGLPTDVDVEVTGADPVLATPVAVGEGAALAHGAVGAAVAALWRERTGVDQAVRVDVGRAARSLLSFLHVRSQPPIAVDRGPGVVVTGLYRCADDRWVHLHGGFPHLAEGTAALLGCSLDGDALAAAVARWRAADLEDALAGAGLCGAIVRTPSEWDAHPQAAALAPLGLVHVERVGDGPVVPVGAGDRPLGGVRVLDLTRVLAGPTVGRTLAEHGADVLLLNGPGRPNVDLFVADTSPGKRSAVVDLATAEGVATARALAAGADVVVDGYRLGALDERGLGGDDLAVGVHVRVSCYGDVGPWAGRRGWEQMAESATGRPTSTRPARRRPASSPPPPATT